jgi:transcription elongation GreA/GreB family factor
MKKQFRLTKEGVDTLQTELKTLTAKRSTIAEAIKSARELGDLSENAEYQSARAEQERNEARISEIENILKSVEIIKKPRAGGKVQLGSSIKLTGGSKTKEFQVVGTVEARSATNHRSARHCSASKRATPSRSRRRPRPSPTRSSKSPKPTDASGRP